MDPPVEKKLEVARANLRKCLEPVACHCLTESKNPDLDESLEKSDEDVEPQSALNDAENSKKKKERKKRNAPDLAPKTEDRLTWKILDYYIKNKRRFFKKERKLWDEFAKQLNVSVRHCSSRLTNIKAVYTSYILRQMLKPDLPIVWRYFTQCHKAFNYREIKRTLRKEYKIPKKEEKWTLSQNKALITYFGDHLYTPGLNRRKKTDADDVSKWEDVASAMGKTALDCRNKFIELRTSYRFIKTSIKKNPDCPRNWKYFKMFEDIYNKPKEVVIQGNDDSNNGDSMDFDTAEDPANTRQEPLHSEDDDIQCIIIIPEDKENKKRQKDTKISNKSKLFNWTDECKIQLLTELYNYAKANRGKLINTKIMWTELSKIIKGKPLGCLRQWCRLKNEYLRLKTVRDLDTIQSSEMYLLVKQILSLKPKFVRPPSQRTPVLRENIKLQELPVYNDVPLPEWIVEKALHYYMDHVEEFNHPMYVKKYAWYDLAKHCGVPVIKIYHKIKYLKQAFDVETKTVGGAEVDFADLLLELLSKEFVCITLCKKDVKNVPEAFSDQSEATWTDEEVKQLLKWYLRNLEKFKSPKYVSSYLWLEASEIFKKSPLACLKKLSAIRRQYSCMVKESPEALNDWRFHKLCQKIYGTGKKKTVEITD